MDLMCQPMLNTIFASYCGKGRQEKSDECVYIGNAYLFEKHACNFAVLDQIRSRPKALTHKSRSAAIVNDLRLRADPTAVCNAAFIALTGYAKHAIIGQNYKLLAAPVLSMVSADRLSRCIGHYSWKNWALPP
jgi:hypothetical protein